MKKIVALLLAMSMLICLGGCGDDKTASTVDKHLAVNELAKDYVNIDDMPDWTGDKLDLIVWYGYGSNETFIGMKPKDDKFRDEIERVTGVRLSEKNSFDNGGTTGDGKVAKLVSTGNWPHIGIGVEASISQSLIESDLLYDLTDRIPKYMPNFWNVINSSPEIKAQWDRAKIDGKSYALKRFNANALKYYDPEYTAEKYASLIQPVDSRSWFWIRDDILKEIYPNAKTQAEIQEIYMKNGSFTKEDLTDVTIKSKEEFRELLKKINDLGLKENGRKVWPFYTHTGEDNWDLMSLFAVPLAGKGAIPSQVTCFSYYDGETDEMKNTMKEKWFKDMMKFFNELVIDGLASKEALVDSKANFEQKKLNGEYAIFYGNAVPPTDEQLKGAGKNYSYRRVMIDIPCDYNKYVRSSTGKGVFANYDMHFFKANLTEDQLEQAMRFMDFFYTDVGMKFANWGSKKAGLYTEDKDGNLRYTDEALKKAKVDNGDHQILVDYGVYSFPRIDYFLVPGGVNKYQPAVYYSNYDEERQPTGYKKYWNYGYFESVPDFPMVDFAWPIWNFPMYVEGADRFWDARQSIEDAMKTVFTATNDKEFEKYYNNMIKVAETNGYTDDCLKEMTKVLKERNGELYEELKNWTVEK